MYKNKTNFSFEKFQGIGIVIVLYLLLFVMEFHMKLPRTTREFLLFMLIISVISVNIIAPLITMFELGFSGEVWYNVLKILPFIWMLVIGIVVLTRKPAEALAKKIITPTDSFNAQMLINTLCSVLLMSILLTIIAPRIGAREVSMDTFTEFFYRRPRNLAIAFAVEAVVAQPIARAVMQQYHLKTDRK